MALRTRARRWALLAVTAGLLRGAGGCSLVSGLSEYELSACGDGTVDAAAGEECDDGGNSDADRCSASCRAQEVLEIVAGETHTCARLSGGSVKCWGFSDYGQLGLGSMTPRGDSADDMGDRLPAIDMGSEARAAGIAAGTLHTCAALEDGQVKCWGMNDSGQLGLGDVEERGNSDGEMGDGLPAVDLGSGRTAVAVTAGRSHTCALLDNGSIKCWGGNGSGQLGQGDVEPRGNEAGELGDALAPVDLGSGRTAIAVTAGHEHTCALLDDGNVKCWGSGSSGKLGQGDLSTRGDTPVDMGDALPPVDLGIGRTATAVSAGGEHTCALLDNGNVKCWGDNTYGQLGLGDTSPRGDQAGEMGEALLVADIGAGRTATAIAAGELHTCALLDDGAVRCWGFNDYGQLGLGDTEWRGDAAGEMGDNLPTVDLGSGATATALRAGVNHTCAVLSRGNLKCWGRNDYAQLGLGDTAFRGIGPDQMGDLLPAVRLFSGGW